MRFYVSVSLFFKLLVLLWLCHKIPLSITSIKLRFKPSAGKCEKRFVVSNYTPTSLCAVKLKHGKPHLSCSQHWNPIFSDPSFHSIDNSIAGLTLDLKGQHFSFVLMVLKLCPNDTQRTGESFKAVTCSILQGGAAGPVSDWQGVDLREGGTWWQAVLLDGTGATRALLPVCIVKLLIEPRKQRDVTKLV